MPRYFLNTLIPRFDARWVIVRLHILPMLVVVGGIFGFYFLSKHVAPGPWTSYPISSISLILLGLTALARLNDIPHENTSTRWQVRRAGLILAGAACLTLTVGPMADHDWPSWREVMMRIGVLLTWMTTSNQPPWHHYMSGEFRTQRVEVAKDVQVQVVRTETDSTGSVFKDGK